MACNPWHGIFGMEIRASYADSMYHPQHGNQGVVFNRRTFHRREITAWIFQGMEVTAWLFKALLRHMALA